MATDPAEQDAHKAVRPVRKMAGREPTSGNGLCLSGGGYRAMIYHLGALWRLNEAGRLRGLSRISSVSGGSITAAALGLQWSALDWHGDVAGNLEALVVSPVRALARETIDVSSVLKGGLPFVSVGDSVSRAYREHVFGAATLQDLPSDDEGPRFVICATNVESGVLFRFSRPYVADYRVGRILSPTLSLADAVAASSAFPPILSPFELDLRDADWESATGNDLVAPKWRGRISLTDGGVYDNLGLETLWKSCRTILVSDGGGHIADEDDPAPDWARHTLRVMKIIDSQVRSLRKRQIVGSFKAQVRDGTMWDIRSPSLSGVPESTVRELAATPTRLQAMDDKRQERLVNWGYLSCDAALRAHVDPTLPPAPGLPYPRERLS